MWRYDFSFYAMFIHNVFIFKRKAYPGNEVEAYRAFRESSFNMTKGGGGGGGVKILKLGSLKF